MRLVVAALAVSVGVPLGVIGPAAPSATAATATELFFSEYLEGSSNNKALEIFNGTDGAINLAAAGYAVQVYFNGSATVGLTISPTGTVAPGDVYVIAHASASAAVLAHADQTNGSGWFNGDDAVALVRSGTIVDVIGRIGFDPGSEWGSGLTSTSDNTLRRKGPVCAGDPDASNVFDPSAEWDGFPQDSVAGLGAHNGCGRPVASCPATLSTTYGTAVSAGVAAVDDADPIAEIVIVSTEVEGIALSGADLADGSAMLEVGDQVGVGRYDVTVSFTTGGTAPESVTCTITVRVNPAGTSLISSVQGLGESSPMAGLDATVEGIVTSLFTSNDQPDGFFLQEEDADADGDPLTSEGLFVFCRGECPAGLAVGDGATVRGPVSEFFGMTQVSSNATGGGVEITSTQNALPTPVPVDLPAAGSTRDAATFEDREGMIATFTDTLVVSEYFELARYGQLVLTVDERPYQFTHMSAPSAAGYTAFLEDLNTRRIVLDDDNNTQNDAIVGPDDDEPYPWPQPGLSVDNRVRGGDTIVSLTGVLHWSFAGQSGTDAWRVRPIQGLTYEFTAANPAPGAPDAVDGRLQVASFNVLNYFATIDTTVSTDEGLCGPDGTQDCRGADSELERQRQLEKIVSALAAMDADVVGLIEIENDAGTATDQIVDALNAAGAGPYAAIDTGFIGTDAIKVALIFQSASIVAVGEHAILDSSVDPEFIDAANRPALIQTFEERATGERFTVAVNHLKSKGSSCDDPEELDLDDPDLGDGAGNCNLTRTRAAEALAEYLAADPTGRGEPDHLIIGDLNAYRMEMPITTLESAGYTDLLEHFVGAGAYTYLFDGQLGYLDHALAGRTALTQVTGATVWPINADEIPLFDYNDDVRDPGEASFERESSALALFEPDHARSSDHDPVLVGLDLLPMRALAGLRQELDGMSIQRGVKTALDAKLSATVTKLDAGDEPAACGSMRGFANHVRAQRAKKITIGDADLLLTEAAQIVSVIGC